MNENLPFSSTEAWHFSGLVGVSRKSRLALQGYLIWPPQVRRWPFRWSKLAKNDVFHLFGKIPVFSLEISKKWLLWTNIQNWICFWVPFCLEVLRASYRAPKDPKLANLGVVVVSPDNQWKIMNKIDFFWVRRLSRIYLEPIDPTLT